MQKNKNHQFIGLIILILTTTIMSCNTSKQIKITNNFPLKIELPMVVPPNLMVYDKNYPDTTLHLYLGYDKKGQIAFNFNNEKNITFDKFDEEFISFRQTLNNSERSRLRVVFFVDQKIPFMYVEYLTEKLTELEQYLIRYVTANGEFINQKKPPFLSCPSSHPFGNSVEEPLFLKKHLDIIAPSLLATWNPIICRVKYTLKRENLSQIHRTETGEIIYNDSLIVSENEIEQLIIKILKEHEDLKNHVFVYKVSPRTSYRNYVYDIATFKKTLHKLWSEITQELNQTDYHNTPREIGRKATSKIPFLQVQSLEDQELIFNLK